MHRLAPAVIKDAVVCPSKLGEADLGEDKEGERKVNKHEIRRRTEKVDEVLGEMIVGSDANLAAIATAVRDVNETLAVHAAWNEERLEAVDDRLVSLARVQVMTGGKVEMLLTGIDSRVMGLGVEQSALGRTLSKVERDQAVLLQDQVAMLQKAERLEQAQESLRHELAALVEAVQGLTARIGELLAHGTFKEMKP